MTALRPERESGPAHGDHGDSSGHRADSAFDGAHDGGHAGYAGAYDGSAQPYEYGAPGVPGGSSGPGGHGGPGQPADGYGGAGADPGAAETQLLPPIGAHPPYVPPQYLPPPADDETVALRIAEPPLARISASAAPAAPPGTDPAPGGRAARRKAAKRRNGRRGGQDAGTAAHETHTTASGSAPGTPGAPGHPGTAAPLSRVEARRQARARKPGAAVVASRAIGEVFITTGVLMLLFVTYQLWWTNVRAHAQAGQEASDLQDDWASGTRNPGSFEPGQGFAILRIPELDVVVPIAEGVSNEKVLDKGMVGHYGEGQLKTAMPGDKTGNFGLAGHRNTHGEPFRFINKLQPGDPIVVETQDTYYVYKMASILPVTSPGNISVLDPVPKDGGFTEPGRYITLTTCTPEFTSKYRMIVWGKMVEERPRSEGKPDALIG
ncbi:class E sortase [Streptomyces sp. NPDC004610]|uniref:class E sortase n=1 Tax=unclassified Streptomyces TaxID=2593676 RepID=UPI0033A99D0B